MAGGLQDLAVARANLLMIPLKNLVPDPENIRTDYGDIKALAASIAEHGVRRPLEVRMVDMGRGARKAMVVDGHRRLQAALYAVKELGAKVEAVPCFPEARGTNEEARVINMLVANDGQKPLEPLEEAQAFKKLLDMGMPEAKLLERTTKSKSYLRSRLDLLAAPRDVRKAVQEKVVSPSAAANLSKATEAVRKKTLDRLAQKKESAGEGAKAASAADVRQEMGVAMPIFNRNRLKEFKAQAARNAETFDNKDAWLGVEWILKVVLGEEQFDHNKTF